MAQSCNFASLLDNAAARWPQATALHFHDQATSYHTLRAKADAWAHALAARGIGPGKSVALLATNVPGFVQAYFGIAKTGAAVLPINPLNQPATIAAQARLCGVAELLVQPALDSPALREALGELRVTSLDELPRAPKESFETVYLPPDSPALWLFTSGTTGAPKAIALSHPSLLFNAMIFRDVLDCRAGDCILAGLPLAYGIGQTGLLNGPMLAGAAVVLLPTFDPREALRLIAHHHVTATIGVPTLYRKVLDALRDTRDGQFAEHWRVTVIGGAPVPAELWAEIEQRLGPQVVIGYGLSETSPLICSSAPGTPPTPHLVGHPVAGVDVSIRDDAGHPVPHGEQGELWARGHNIGLHYRVAADAPCPDAFDGIWFKTGDIARMAEDGQVYILGRKKELIIRSGHKIAPAEIEHALLRHSAITAAAVLGIPDHVVGEEIAACVTLRDRTIDEAGLVQWCREHFAPNVAPRRVKVLDALPLGPTGKVLKAELAHLFA